MKRPRTPSPAQSKTRPARRGGAADAAAATRQVARTGPRAPVASSLNHLQEELTAGGPMKGTGDHGQSGSATVSAPPPRPLPQSLRRARLAPPLSALQEKDRLDAIANSPSYLRAYEDMAFLKTKELRPVRLQLELLKPELILQDEKVESTIVVFGGTRIVEGPEARARVAAISKKLKRAPDNPELVRELAVAMRILAKSKYYDEAREFGRIVSRSCQIDGQCDYVIMTGGGPGVMEAANRGAYDVGAKSIGMNITLPHEQNPNPYITPELCFQFHYFAIRKMHLLLRAKALVAFPGGYGTLDELFETLTLVQTLKVHPLPVLLFGRDFWRRVIDFQYLVDEGVIDSQDIGLFSMVETAEEAWQKICDFYAAAPLPNPGA